MPRKQAKAGPGDAAPAIAEARSSLATGDVRAAVDALVRAWTLLPSERIAKTAVSLSARLPPESLPAKVVDRDRRWLELAASHDPATLPTLLAAEWPVHPREAKKRLAELVEFPPDPRIATALTDLWRAKRYRSNAGNAFWKSAFRTLFDWGDPVAGDYADAERRREDIEWFSIFQPLRKKSKAPRALQPMLDTATERELVGLESSMNNIAATSSVTRKALLDAVYDDPASDAPRLVLADALLAEGDPRGELIQLQLSGKRGAEKRIAALLRAHYTTWHGELEGLVHAPVFRRGFIAEATVDGEQRDLDLRAWRTVETLRFRSIGKIQRDRVLAMLRHPNFAGVRDVQRLPASLAAEWLPTATSSLDRLGLLAPLVPIPSCAVAVREVVLADTYSQLDEDGDDEIAPMRIAAILAWFASSPLAATARSLVIDRIDNDLLVAWQWLQGSNLEVLTLMPGTIDYPVAWALEIRRDAIRATWHGRLYGERAPAGLGVVLTALPTDALTSFTASSAVRLEPEQKKAFTAELTTALARQTRLKSPKIFA